MMKLSKKVVHYFIFSSLLVFVLGSVTFYFVLKALIAEEVDETLASEETRIVKQLEHGTQPIPNWATINLEIRRIPQGIPERETWNDTVIYVKETNETIPMRQLHFYTKLKSGNYRITLRRSLIEKEDLMTGVFGVMVGIFITMILILNAVNIRSDRKLWQPFYAALKQLNNFALNSNRPLNLPSATIKEFDQLNKTLNIMAEKLQTDYRNLKEFSENAAHEMQTPLAVIRSKLDVLIQDRNLSAEQLQIIQSLYHAVNRLTRLNQSLNLLTKIENREFNEKHQVNFNRLIEQQLVNLSELIQMNELKVETRFNSVFVKPFNPFMAETLISNLLINAVKHNIPQGFIDIETTTDSIVLTNSGPSLQSNPDELFKRFKKDHPTADSPGLGLSIVQSICRQNGLEVKYRYKEKSHFIKITNHTEP